MSHQTQIDKEIANICLEKDVLLNLYNLMRWDSPNIKLKEQVSWLVGNICAVNDEKLSRQIIGTGVIDVFWPYLRQKISFDLTERILLIFGNLIYKDTELKSHFISNGYFREILQIPENECYVLHNNWPQLTETFLFFLSNFIDSDLVNIGITFKDCLPL